MTLFYSDRCQYSRRFLEKLNQCHTIKESIQMVNIDNQSVDLPAFVRSVPSMIIENNLISG